MLKIFLCTFLVSILLLCQGILGAPAGEDPTSEAVVKRELSQADWADFESEFGKLDDQRQRIISRIAKRMVPVFMKLPVGKLIDSKNHVVHLSKLKKRSLEEIEPQDVEEHVSRLLKRGLSETDRYQEESDYLDSKLLEIGLEEDKDGVLFGGLLKSLWNSRLGGLGKSGFKLGFRVGFRVIRNLVVRIVLGRLIPGYQNLTVRGLLLRYYAPEFTPAIMEFLNTKIPNIFSYDLNLLGPGFERFKHVYNSIRRKSIREYLRLLLFGGPLWV
ncbi:hypothetical protein K493DRAFT_367667 [Basidiobolus meristosporus CBS 931.73]|uniref:Uncharacterized protein n=1 Tax=Basidiobolus meristosporus CBS 931.73 TaxID=1314790 RepID=A0A1Y1VVY6_9FUNG|nr:hypothetical protein K493DRAFT_367667 [Basidiobolus meristosporus CBS 931.73]|eukprot:ORX65451.1 hypothetical protein K493DRAFT_367667 [Basidiobolus meristosporus CBS 931.73]